MTTRDPASAPTRPERGPLGAPFWQLVTSSGLSNLADGIFKTALPLVAVTFTRSPSLVAGVEIARSLPWLLFALQAGALADRLDRRRTMLLANLARGLIVAVLATLLATGDGSVWVVYLIALGTGIAEVLYDTAAQSILPALVARPQLPRANGRLYAVELGAQQFAGPPLAGVLFALAVAWSFAGPAVLWAVAVGALWLLKGAYRPARVGEPATLRADIAEGLRYLRGHRELRLLAALTGASNLVSSAAFAVFVLFAVGAASAMQMTEPEYGLLLTVLAIGSLVGSLVTDRVVRAIGRAWAIRVSTVAFASIILAPAVTAEVWVIGAAMFVSGVGVMLWNIPTVSFRQSVVPDHLLGRINSAYRLLAWGSMPIGALLGGLFGEWFGVRAVFAIMGVISLLLLIPTVRLTDARLDAAEGAAWHG